MIREIYHIILKNILVLTKDKYLLSILFIMPIFLIFIFGGIYFNTENYNLKVGLVIENKTNLYNKYKSSLENYNLKIFEYDTFENCSFDIKNGVLNTCIIFENNFKIEDGRVLNLEIVLDSTKKNIYPILENYLIRIIEIENRNARENIILELVQNIESSKEIFDYSSKKISENLKKNNDMISNTLNIKNTQKDIQENIENSNETINRIKDLTNENVEILETKKENIEDDLDEIEDILSSIQIDSADENKIEDEISSIRNEINSLNSFDTSYDLEKSLDEILDISYKIIEIENSADKINSELEIQNQDFINMKRVQEESNDDIKNIQILNLDTILTPVKSTLTLSNEETTNHLKSIFPSILVGIICIISILFSSIFESNERCSRGYFRNVISKQSTIIFTLGNFLFLFLVMYILTSFFILLYQFLFSQIHQNILFLIIFPILIFVLIGMYIGSLGKTHLEVLITDFLVLMILLIFSGKILPLEIFTQNFYNILLSINPYLLVEIIFRKFFFFGVFYPIEEIIKLLILIVIIFILLIFRESYNMRRDIYFFIVGVKMTFINFIRKKFNIKSKYEDDKKDNNELKPFKKELNDFLNKK